MTSDIIQKCREVPIHRIVGLTNLSRRAKICCPFHADRTASCTLFPTGGFHCFGCGANGNTVDFVVRLSTQPTDEEKFKEAIKELTKYI